ncbi:MAG: hypothetical protein ACRDTA_16380 [Pseudonocardiaceae bacterium]
MQPELPSSGGVAVDFDLGSQGDENQAAEGESDGFEAGGVFGQAHGVVDDRDQFGAGGGEMGEGVRARSPSVGGAVLGR